MREVLDEWIDYDQNIKTMSMMIQLTKKMTILKEL